MDDNLYLNRMKESWSILYQGSSDDIFEGFINELQAFRQSSALAPQEEGWYKDSVVYSLYVDLFASDFKGLESRLDYLSELGVTCLWLLPILDSPMKDAGFDIRDYKQIRHELSGLNALAPTSERLEVFKAFLNKAHEKGIRVIFDVALNHTSNEHFWFQESRKGPDNPYRAYYIWNKDTNLYKETRLLFKGMCPSNWEKDGGYYFFHRFFEFQPDLNYKNPRVLIEMSKVLLHWLEQGVDGFRADAIPYLWKEDGTNCENLPQTHTIVRFLRAMLDYARPNTLLLAEACQPPVEVVKYFGNGDECHAGYHFPIMPQIFKAMAVERVKPIIETLHSSVTPEIDPDNQWFMFLRLHDELTLEMVSEDDRKLIHDYYCKKPEWDFRVGEGVSARLSELLGHDDRRMGLAYSLMFTLPGTPLVYYGDEYGKSNDVDYYNEMKRMTGYNDTRYFVRGPFDWEMATDGIRKEGSFAMKINKRLKEMIRVRNQWKAFGRGNLEWLHLKDAEGNPLENIASYFRTFRDEKILIVQNLSSAGVSAFIGKPTESGNIINLLSNPLHYEDGLLRLSAYEYFWLAIKE